MSTKKQILTLGSCLLLLILLLGLWQLLRRQLDSPYTSTGAVAAYTAQSEVMDIAIHNSTGSYNIQLVYSDAGPTYRVAQLGEDIPLYSGRLARIGGGAVQLMAADCYENESGLAQYGLADPAANAVLSFADGTVTTLYIGDLSPDEVNVYLLAEGDNLRTEVSAVYLVSLDDVDHILLGATDLISPAVTGSYPSGGYFDTATLWGSVRDYPITVTRTQGDDGSAYIVQELLTRNLNPTGGLAVLLGVYGITAQQAVAIHPTKEMLENYGLMEPYSAIRLESGAETLELAASRPDEDGLCYLYRTGNPVVYQVDASLLRWLEVDFSTLSDPTLFTPPGLEQLSRIQLTYDGDSYLLAFSQNTEADPDVTINGQPVPMDTLRPILQRLFSTQSTGYEYELPEAPQQLLSITFTYLDGSQDSLLFYEGRGGGKWFYTSVNGSPPHLVSPVLFLQDIVEDLALLARG